MNRLRLSRGQLAKKAVTRRAAGFLILLTMLLLPAGTLTCWQAWAFMGVIVAPMALAFAYLLVCNPELLERRMRMKEKNAQQSHIVKLGAVCYAIAFLIPGFDHRFGWSHVPFAAVFVADAVVLLGYGWFMLVLRENSHASRIVEVEPGQRVITTGPYTLVRHPMYLGVLVMFFATPVALGSWWALIPVLPLIAVLVARILNEEQLLIKELQGYQDYTQTTRYRLIPGIW